MSARLGRIAAHLGRSASSSSATSDAPPPRRGVQHEVAGAAGATVPCLDFGYSFISGAGPMCAIRFVVESRCTVYDDTAGTVKIFYQLASCKSEDTFGRGTSRSGKNLFQDPNYDFCPMYCTPTAPQSEEEGLALDGGDYVCWRRKLDYAAPQLLAAGYNGRSQPVHGYRQTDDDPASSPFGPAALRLTTAAGYEVDVADFAAVKAATEACHPLVQVTEMTGAAAGLRAVIECPVKTMNLAVETDNEEHHPAGTWQVDTGPVAVPDLSRRYERPSDAISLGFIAINNLQPEAADFVIEQPTPLPDHPEIKVLHYSAPIPPPSYS